MSLIDCGNIAASVNRKRDLHRAAPFLAFLPISIVANRENSDAFGRQIFGFWNERVAKNFWLEGLDKGFGLGCRLVQLTFPGPQQRGTGTPSFYWFGRVIGTGAARQWKR